MAQSTCPKCDNQSFELAENTPRGSQHKLMFIQCDKCGAVVGVVDYHNISTLVKNLAKALGVLDIR